MGGLRWTTARLAVALFMLLPKVFAAEGASPREVAAAESFFRTGVDAFQAGDHRVALRSFQRAFELHASYRSATMLAQVELQLGRFAQSATHLDVALKLLPMGAEPETRKKLLRALKQTRSRVATIGFRPNVKTAQLFADGQLLANGRVAHDLYVLPGSYQLEVRARGYRPYFHRLTLSEGSQRELIVNLKSVPNLTTDIDTRSPVPRASTHRGLLIGGMGLSLVGLGVGSYGLIRHRSAQDSEDRSRFRGIALGGFIGSALVAAATGVVYYTLSEDSQQNAMALTLALGPPGHGSGLAVGAWGTF